MKLAIIGAGNIAGRHAANLRYLDSARVAAVCDVDESRAQALAGPFQAAVYSQPDAMFDAVQDLDAVLLCTPPAVRLPIFARAADQGVHVFCEKPPADSLESAAEISALIESSGILCSVGFHHRYSPVLPAFRELTAEEPLSTVQSTHVAGNAFSSAMPPWFFLQERSGGHVMDQAIHNVDLLRHLVGEIAEVHTLANNLSVPVSDAFDIADTTLTLIRFENGVSASHLHSWGSHVSKSDLTFVGRNLQLQLRTISPPRLQGRRRLENGELEEIRIQHDEGPSMGREDMEVNLGGPHPPDPPHFGALETFLQAVASQQPELFKSDFPDATRTLAVVLAMNRSAEIGRPVSLA